MTGREPKEENDLFFVCSLIEQIARATKNRRGEVAAALGTAEVARLLGLADVLHCEPLEKTADGLIHRHGVREGAFDNVADCRYGIPSVFDIGKVYKRLAVAVAKHDGTPLADALVRVYTSWISPKIDDYNSSMYYEPPDYLFQSWLAGEPLKED
jgi:hypothetical protein